MGLREFDGRRYLDGCASDPRKLGWMRGAPPLVDKRIAREGDTFLHLPQIRWSLSHMRELVPTVNVWRGRGGPSPLDRSDKAADVDALTFTDTDGRARRFDEALFDTYADGIVVRIVDALCTSATSARSRRSCRIAACRLRSHTRER